MTLDHPMAHWLRCGLLSTAACIAAAPALGQAAAAPVPVATPASTATATATPGACTDFYAHVNADWLSHTQLPPDRARTGSFDQLVVANQRVLQAALARLVAEPARQDSPGLKLLATRYAGALDPAVARRDGLRAAQPLLDRISALGGAAQSGAPLPALLGELARHGLATPMALWVAPDSQDVRHHALYLAQGGLGLPEPGDYLNDDATSQRLRAAYQRHAQRLLALAGAPHDEATLQALMAFETSLARAAMGPVQRRDPQATNNRRTLAQLQQEAPGLDWSAWLQAVGVRLPADAEPPLRLLLAQPRFAQALGQLVQTAPVASWQSYLRVRLLDALAPWLDTPFQQSHFDYHEQALRGIQQPPPRHEQLIALIGGRTGNEPLGLALGELFVRERFSPQAQARALQLIEDVREAMRVRITQLPWMGEATKARALEKLAAMAPLVGAPAQWPTYDGLQLDAASPAGNLLHSKRWGFAQRLADLGQPVPRGRWQTSPHIVNAFAGSLNRIVFPAGILQPPFFDAEGDDAANYGGIGMVIGHEITHHFDDRGRQYDAVGNLADWWTAEDASAYRARADRVVALYSQYEPLPGLRINGRQMLGENISDLGGLQIAFDAYQRALARRAAAGVPGPGVATSPVPAGAQPGGMTPEQRFFIANAVIWRSKQRPQALEQQLRTGQHSPGPYRVRGPMSNMPAFAAAFGCQPGDAMVASDPVAVW